MFFMLTTFIALKSFLPKISSIVSRIANMFITRSVGILMFLKKLCIWNKSKKLGVFSAFSLTADFLRWQITLLCILGIFLLLLESLSVLVPLLKLQVWYPKIVNWILPKHFLRLRNIGKYLSRSILPKSQNAPISRFIRTLYSRNLGSDRSNAFCSRFGVAARAFCDQFCYLW